MVEESYKIVQNCTPSNKFEVMKNIELPSIFKNGRSYSTSSCPRLQYILGSRKRGPESQSPPKDEPADRQRRIHSPDKGIYDDNTIENETNKATENEASELENEENNEDIEDDLNKVTTEEASKSVELNNKEESESNNLVKMSDKEESPTNQLYGKDAFLEAYNYEPQKESEDIGIGAIMIAIQCAVTKAMEPLTKKVVEQNNLINKLDSKINMLTDQLSKRTNSSCQHPVQNLTQKLAAHSNPENWGLAGQGRVNNKPATNLLISTADLNDRDIFKPDSYADMVKSRSTAEASAELSNVIKIPPPQLKSAPLNPAYKLARRCQGFHPLSSRDIGRVGAHYAHIIDDEARFQAAGKDCVREFLYNELKMSERVINDLRIVSVFFPPAGAGKATLFAEFHNEEEVQLIKSYAKNLAPTEKYPAMLVHYIPRSLQQRFTAIETMAHKIRHDSKKTIMTRIWIGNDFELRTKKKGDSTNWAAITPLVLNDLPPQAPKSTRHKSDIIDTRTPITPCPIVPCLITDDVFFNVPISNHFDLLEVDVQN